MSALKYFELLPKKMLNCKHLYFFYPKIATIQSVMKTEDLSFQIKNLKFIKVTFWLLCYLHRPKITNIRYLWVIKLLSNKFSLRTRPIRQSCWQVGTRGWCKGSSGFVTIWNTDALQLLLSFIWSSIDISKATYNFLITVK